MAAMQVQIQALLVAVGGGGGDTATGTNAGSQIEVAKPAIFNGEAGRVGGFVSACKIYIYNIDICIIANFVRFYYDI